MRSPDQTNKSLGEAAGGFSQDWYQRVEVVPVLLALGLVVIPKDISKVTI
jgi:hypothetical protein